MTDDTTPDAALSARLPEIQARADAATPGPWEAGDVWVFTDPIYTDDRRLSSVLGMDYADKERAASERQRGLQNAEFIAHAREDVPALLAEVARLDARAVAAEKRATEAAHDAAEWERLAWDANKRAMKAEAEVARLQSDYDECLLQLEATQELAENMRLRWSEADDQLAAPEKKGE